MINRAKQWMAVAPWESVVTLNKALCLAQKAEALTNLKTFDSARQLWEKSVPTAMTMIEAFEVCRRAHRLTPFVFNNGNTFAALGCTLVEDHLQSLLPVESQILRTTIGHYICGVIGRREFLQVLRHFDPMLDARAVSVSAPAPSVAPASETPPATAAASPVVPASPTPAPHVPLGLPREQGV